MSAGQRTKYWHGARCVMYDGFMRRSRNLVENTSACVADDPIRWARAFARAFEEAGPLHYL